MSTEARHCAGHDTLPQIRARVVDFGALSVGPVLLTLALGVACSVAFGSLLAPEILDNLIIWVSMPAAMIVLPVLYLRYVHGQVALSQLGVLRPDVLSASSIALLLAAIVVFKYQQGANMLAILAQNIPIAVAEEFWCKGVLFYQARTFLRNQGWVIVVCALVFTFVTHANGTLEANLLYRLPMGLLTGFIYLKTRSLAWPIALHFAYNMYIS